MRVADCLARQRFAALIGQPEGAIRLDLAALLIAQEEYPHLDCARYLNRLDVMALDVRGALAGRADALAIVAALNRYLFDQEGFYGAADYDDPRDSYLNDVLERRSGIPISLSIVYMEVARRLGLTLYGVGAPGHFLVRYDGPTPDNEPLLLDPFNGGAALSLDDCRRRFAVLPHPGRLALDYLAPVGVPYILARMLTNLTALYLRQGDHARALAATDRLLLLRPTDPAQPRNRAAIHLARGDLAAALQDLRGYLTLAPHAPDAPAVRAQVQALWRRLALLN